MLDLIADSNCLSLDEQSSLASPQTEGWGESSVEEIVAKLKWAYQNREHAQTIGANAARWMTEHRRTWKDHAGDLLQWITHSSPN
jgi:hypothetical protein